MTAYKMEYRGYLFGFDTVICVIVIVCCSIPDI